MDLSLVPVLINLGQPRPLLDSRGAKVVGFDYFQMHKWFLFHYITHDLQLKPPQLRATYKYSLLAPCI